MRDSRLIHSDSSRAAASICLWRRRGGEVARTENLVLVRLPYGVELLDTPVEDRLPAADFVAERPQRRPLATARQTTNKSECRTHELRELQELFHQHVVSKKIAREVNELQVPSKRTARVG